MALRDCWVDDPHGGAAIDLADPDIRQRKAHILKQAFDGLDPLGRELIARLAMIANAVDWQVLYTLNPERPAWPEHVNRPTPPEFRTDSRLDRLWQQHTAAKRPKDRTGLEQQIHDLEHELTEHYEAEQRAFTQFQREHAAWGKGRRCGIEAIERHSVRSGNPRPAAMRPARKEIRPVVRGYVVQSLAADARAETGQSAWPIISSPAPTGGSRMPRRRQTCRTRSKSSRRSPWLARRRRRGLC